MTKDQAKQLKAAIKRLVEAAIHDSWKGAKEKGEAPEIEAELASAQLKVNTLIGRFTGAPNE